MSWHYVYKICFEDGRFYIGLRTCKNCTPWHDKYAGSPSDKSLWKTVPFVKHIVAIFNSRHEAHSFEIRLIKSLIALPGCINLKPMPDRTEEQIAFAAEQAAKVHRAKALLGLHQAQISAKNGTLNFQSDKALIARNIEATKARNDKLLAEGLHCFQLQTNEQRKQQCATALQNGTHSFLRPECRAKSERTKRIKSRSRIAEDDYNRLRLIYASYNCKNLPKHLIAYFSWKEQTNTGRRSELKAIARGLNYFDFISGL